MTDRADGAWRGLAREVGQGSSLQTPGDEEPMTDFKHQAFEQQPSLVQLTLMVLLLYGLSQLLQWPQLAIDPQRSIEPQAPEVTPPAKKKTPSSRLVLEQQLPDLLPDFGSRSVSERKRAFVSFVLPHIERENERVVRLRERLQQLAAVKSFSAEEIDWMQTVAEQFRLQNASNPRQLLQRLLHRVDMLPPSLVLAQAAIESAWGTSRFARKGNNLFGHWCMVEGCGLLPSKRSAQASHEVKKFDSVEQSVRRYFLNLNSNPAYSELRRIRACHRSLGEPLSGPVMAGGLLAYSGRGADYIESLRGIIYSNQWHEMDGAEEEASTCAVTEEDYGRSLAARD